MRILIISDTHGKTDSIKRVLEKVGDIDMLIHLGDVCGDENYITEHCGCPVHMVRGNNDWGSPLPDEEEFMIGKYKIFITHGHRYSVHYGTDRLEYLAMEKGYDIVIFGHTHVEHLETIGPTTYLNPGSLAYPRESRDGTFVLMEFDQHGKPFFARNTLPRSEKKKRFIW